MAKTSYPATPEDVAGALIDAGGIAVMRLPDASTVRPAAQALLEGGVRAIEITMTVPDAIGQIADLAGAMPDEILLGVGSVTDAETARRAIDAGARYVVSPVFKEDILRASHDLGAAALPGCFTPTEIQMAHEAGADIIKVFPADILGMAFFRAVLAPLPHLKLMPTGGVTLENAGDWLRAGACAVGVGSALLDRTAITEGRYDIITMNARRLRSSLDTAR